MKNTPGIPSSIEKPGSEKNSPQRLSDLISHEKFLGVLLDEKHAINTLETQKLETSDEKLKFDIESKIKQLKRLRIRNPESLLSIEELKKKLEETIESIKATI